MKIKAFFLAILMLSLSHFVYAAVSGTSTIGTQTTNDIVSISIVPTDDVINAGESIQFVAVAIDNEGMFQSTPPHGGRPFAYNSLQVK